MQTNKMHTFRINVLIQFLVSSTCFEHHVLIIRKIFCTCTLYGMFLMHLRKPSSRWKDVLGTLTVYLYRRNILYTYIFIYLFIYNYK